MRRKETSPRDIVRCLILPHLEMGGSWHLSNSGAPLNKPEALGYKRLLCYAEILLKAGVPDWQIGGMFADLYWDAFHEFLALQKNKQGWPSAR
jgi:hypothetical protein